jgi:autotransporter-associated beta strand protein
MNRIYNIIFNRSKGCLVAVGENVTGQGKGKSKSSQVGGSSISPYRGRLASIPSKKKLLQLIDTGKSIASGLKIFPLLTIVFVYCAEIAPAVAYDNPSGSSVTGDFTTSDSLVTNEGTINGADYAFTASGVNAVIINSGVINGEVHLDGSGQSMTNTTAGVINITGGYLGVFLGSNVTFSNNGTITGDGQGNNNYLLNSSGYQNIINNSGSMIGGSSDNVIVGSGFKFINNTGSIITLDTCAICIQNGNSGGVDILTNTGTINSTGTSNSYGITNSVYIAQLNNAQGVGNTAGALTYSGQLPSYYNIMVASPTNYGQLAVSNPSSAMTFGIYAGSSLSVGTTYTSVLSGITAANLNSSSGIFNGNQWRLSQSDVPNHIWDLSLSPYIYDDSHPYLSSDITNTTNQVFDGQILKMVSARTIANNFAITDQHGTIDQNGFASTFSGIISDFSNGINGKLIFTNSGAGGSITLSGSNTYSGGTELDPGANLMINNPSAIGSGPLAFMGAISNPATLTTNATMTISNPIAVSGLANFNVASGVTTINTPINDGLGSGSVMVSGGGTLNFAQANNYSGMTSINSGSTLKLVDTGSIESSSSVINNGTFDISATNTAGTSISSLSGNGAITLGAKDLAINSGNFAGAITGTGGLIAGGNLSLSGANTYSGQTQINEGGTLNLTGSGSIASSSGLLFPGPHGNNGVSIFDISGTSAGATVNSLSSEVEYTNAGSFVKVNLGAQNLTIANGGDFRGNISGTGGLNITGGTQILSRASTYTGTTNIGYGATLRVTSQGSLASNLIVNAGTLYSNNWVSGGYIPSNYSILINGAPSNNQYGVLNLERLPASYAMNFGINSASSTSMLNFGSTYTYIDVITGLSSINNIVGASGTSAGLSYSLIPVDPIAPDHWNLVVTPVATNRNLVVTPVATNIQSGSTNLLSSVGGALNPVLDGGTLKVDVAGANATAFTITSNNGTINQNGLSSNLSGNITDSGVGVHGKLTISNPASTAGLVTLSGTNTYSGGTVVEAGANLSISSANNIGTGSLALVGNSTTPATLTTTATMTIANSITVAGDPVFNVAPTTTTTIASPITDGVSSGDVVVSAGGTLALTAVNTYTGLTDINPGSTLALSGTGSIAASSGLTNNGTFNITGKTGNVSIANYTQGSSGTLTMNLSPSGSQKLNVAGVTSLAGNLVLNAAPGSYSKNLYTTILTSSAGITGKFSSLSTNLGSYTNYGYFLTYDANDVYLYIDPPSPYPSTADTQQSLVNTAASLQSTFALQNSVLANSFSYDCNEFGANGVCISVGGRNTAVSAANGLNNTSGLLIAAYRPHPNYRIGAYVDQNLSVKNAGSTVTLGNNTPLIGLFGAWNQRLDGTGTEVKVSAAYGQKNTTVTRSVVGTSEAGSGSSQLNSQGAQVTAKYGFAVTDKAIVSPYVGIRYAQNNMGGYTEGTSSSVTAPLTYSALNTNATTALAGVGASYKVIPKVTTFASVGIETDTNKANGSYYGTNSNIAGLTPVNFNANPVKTRPTATLGAYYDVTKNQRLGITGIYRQESYQAVSTTTVMATYSVGF